MPERGLVLVGASGSGKTTLGRLMADRLGRRLIDTDALIEARTGLPPHEHLRRGGEAEFRQIEADAISEACAHHGAIIATGGGAVLDPLNRWALWHHGTVAWLDAPAEVLVGRLEADGVERPLARPYRSETLAAMLAARLPFYRAADHRLDATADPEALVGELVAMVERETPISRRLFDAEIDRHHPIGPPRTRVVMGLDLVTPVLDGVVIIDRRLAHAGPPILANARCLAIAGGEGAKRLHRLGEILEWLAGQRVERGTTLVAIGGGTIGDLAGTAAALFARGLPLVQVPTTWLAQADSAIGGKVAIDLRAAKNAAGAFWPPVEIISDVVALRSLPLRHRREGMAESIKSALIGDPGLWSLLESRGAASLQHDEAARYAIIERSARLKLDVCARDPFEAGERRTLNLGHTIGHALEIASGYRLAHGSAVAMGLRAVAAITTGRGADRDLAPRLDALLDALGFQLRLAFDDSAVRAALHGDKKRAGNRQRWILPMTVGRVVEVDDVTDAELKRALRAIAA